MCGIAGVINYGEREILPRENWESFADPLKYRGPDGYGEWHHADNLVSVSFFHTRLSVIELSILGKQPMESASGNLVITFNGEIYNYQGLRDELLNRGFFFRSSSDTEVVLNAFECWGIRATLEKLDGMFAFAMFDKRNNSLVLARDRFGKKPLYFFAGNKALAFSSDIRSFRKILTNLTVDLHSLGYYFAEQSTPQARSIWKEVDKVKPGAFVLSNEFNICDQKKYWDIEYTEDCRLSRGEIIEKVDSLLSNAVRKRLVADVNVSALLSGGIDSSLVVAKMAKQSAKRVRTYSVGFMEDNYNELPYARQVAKRFDTDHTEIVVGPSDLSGIDDLITEYGEPFADASMIPTYLMSREISKREKVVLTGDGGDELFAGYDSYYFAHKFDRFKKLGFAYSVAKMLSRVYPCYRTGFLEGLLRATKLPRYNLLNRNFSFNETDLQSLLPHRDFVNAMRVEHCYIWENFAPNSSNDLINLMSASIKTRLLNDYLVKIDRASMYASLEMRSPFLDKDLAEFAATLKPSQLFHRSETKSILKAVSRKYFDEEFIQRKKMGFEIPIGTWIRVQNIGNFRERILGAKQKIVELDYQFIEKLLAEHLAGVANHTQKLWSLYVFHVWADNNG